MKHFFIKLYLSLVVTIVVSGILLNYLWSSIIAVDETDQSRKLFETTSALLIESDDTQQFLDSLNRLENGYWEIISQESLAIDKHLSASFSQGESYSFEDEIGVIHWFRKLDKLSGSQEQFEYLTWSMPITDEKNIWYEKVFIFTFYAIIGLVLVITLLPFSREIKRFSQQIKLFGESNWQHRLDVHDQSLFSDFAANFNIMAGRIEELVETQKELTHSVSHELRTPLARMKFALEDLSNENKNQEEQEHNREQIRSDIVELENLINELLDYAEFDSQYFHLDLIKENINEVTQSIIDNHKKFSTKDWHYHCAEPIQLTFDWHLYERLLSNLFVNAEKFSHSQIKVEITQCHEQVKIVIEDDGPGIPESQRDKVFQSFYKAKASNIASKGFGLGLAIVSRIVQMHQGHIRIDQSSLGGCKFIITLPTK